MAPTGETVVICTLLMAVLRISLCSAEDYNIKLENFTVLTIDPDEYRIDSETNVTFSADLINSGPNQVNTTAAGSINIIFLVLRVHGVNVETIGKVPVTIKNVWNHLDVLRVNQDALVTITKETCANLSATPQMCAGVSFPNQNYLSSETIDCVNFQTIENGGAGEINCETTVLPYGIALLAIFSLLLVVFIVLLCRREWDKRRRRRETPIDVDESNNVARRRGISLAHIYEDLSNRVSNRLAQMHMPSRGRTDDETNPYEFRFSKGTENDAFQPENMNIQFDISTHGESEDADDSTPDLFRSILSVKRPSQPNEYIIADVSLIHRLSPLNEELTMPIEGIPDWDTTDQMEYTDPNGNVVGHAAESRHETGVVSETIVACELQPLELGQVDDEENLNPVVPRRRASSVDIPLRDAPDIPPARNRDPDPVPDPSPVPNPDPESPVPNPDAESEMQFTLLPNPTFDSSNPVSDDPDPDPDPVLDPIVDPTPVSDHKPKLKPKPDPKPVLTLDTNLDPRGDSYPDPDQLITISDPVTPHDSQYDPPAEGVLSAHGNQGADDEANKPKRPVPMPRKYSGQGTDGSGQITVPARPILPAKPIRLSKSDPGLIKNDDQIPDWSSSSTSSASKSSPPKPKLSIYKGPQDFKDISYSPSVTPRTNINPAPSQKGGVDLKVMEAAINKTRDSTIKPPDPAEFITQPDSSRSDGSESSVASPTDPEFMLAVMENYMALMYEMSKGEDDYEVSIKREKDRVDSDKPLVEPRLCRRRKSYSAQLLLKQKRKTIQSGGVYVNQWNRSWEFNRANLTVDREEPLGEGQFGKVYKAVATGVNDREGRILVAVKELKGEANLNDKDEFLKELAIHTIIKKHPHVVELLGCCIRDDPICIITEYLSGGNLLGFLREKPARQTGREMVLHYLAKFGLHIVRGMAYVAEMEVVHRDLAARNILISAEEVCKVADFGFARDIFGIQYYPQAPDKAPIRWYAPESILDNLFSTKSDVWSFGILLFEIATLGRVAPYQGRNNDEVRCHVSAGMHPTKPPHCDNNIFDIMKKCWSKKADDRPSFSKLVNIFEDIQGQYPDPSQVDQDVWLNGEDEESSF